MGNNNREFVLFVTMFIVVVGVSGFIIRESIIADNNYEPRVVSGIVTKSFSETRYEGNPRFYVVLDRKHTLRITRNTFTVLMEGDIVTCTKTTSRGLWSVKIDG